MIFLCSAATIALLLSNPSRLLSPAENTVLVRPGENVEALVRSHPPDTSFRFSPGTYRQQSISPKDGDSFLGKPGVDLTGAQILTSFSRKGRYWLARVKVQSQRTYRGECQDGRPACVYPEDLFVDDVPLQRVTDLSEVAPGRWYLDYRTSAVYLADNPSGRKVEISLSSYAFNGSAKNVTIRGLTVEKYASAAGDGAIGGSASDGRGADGWVVQDNVVKFNHGMGIRVSNEMRVLSNMIVYNGQMGLGGSGNNILVAGNEIAYNNYAGYSFGWEAGGCKFTFTKDLVIRNNFSHNNNGPGLWTDIENHDTLYEHNHTTANKIAGILHEISYHAVIRDNTIENDALNTPKRQSPWYGGGIVINASADVEVYGNAVTDCTNGIVGLQAVRASASGRPYLLRNLFVHNNVITQNTGIAAGILASRVFGDSVFTSWGNRFADNTFHLAKPQGKYFMWLDAPQTLTAWGRR